MWKTLILLWSVSLCLSDSKIKTLVENTVHLQEGSEIGNENECRQICRESLSTNNLYCRKALIPDKWCTIKLCNRLCRTTAAQMISDPPVGINYLKKRRKRNTRKGHTDNFSTKREVADIATPAATTPSKTPTRNYIKTFTLEATTEPIKTTTSLEKTIKTIPAIFSTAGTTSTTTTESTTSAEHPEKRATKSPKMTKATPAASTTARITTTAESTTSTKPIITAAKNSSITLNGTELNPAGANTTKTVYTSKPPAINITDATTEQTNPMLITGQGNDIEKTHGTVPTVIKNSVPTVTVRTLFSTSPKKQLPANPTETNITKGTMPSVILTTEEPDQFQTASTSPTTTTILTTTQIATSELTKQLTTTRPRELTVPNTTIPIPLATKLSSPNETTSMAKPGIRSSTSSNPTTSKVSKPESYVLTSTQIYAASSIQDGNQQKGDGIIVIAGEVSKYVQNTSFLLAVLLLGNLFFIAVIVLFVLQAYENYKKKDYTQVDYLINGMYADSEM